MKYAKITIMRNENDIKMEMQGDSKNIVQALTQGLLEVLTDLLRDGVPVERAAHLLAKDIEADFLKMARAKATEDADDQTHAEPDTGTDDDAERDEAVDEAVEFFGRHMESDEADDFAAFLESVAKRIKGNDNG